MQARMWDLRAWSPADRWADFGWGSARWERDPEGWYRVQIRPAGTDHVIQARLREPPQLHTLDALFWGLLSGAATTPDEAGALARAAGLVE